MKPSATPVVVAWSSGKDSAWALHEVRRQGGYNVVGLLTTVTETFDRVSMHGVRSELVRAQARSLGLPLKVVSIPSPCPNEIYEARMGSAMKDLADSGVRHVVFGDLFLEDVRRYRETQLARAGMTGVFPLWGRATSGLLAHMLEAGTQTVLVCVDPRKLPQSFAGEWLTPSLVARFPAGVDPCGENGEFHTFVASGPMFPKPIPVRVGERVIRDGFAFADLTLASAPE